MATMAAAAVSRVRRRARFASSSVTNCRMAGKAEVAGGRFCVGASAGGAGGAGVLLAMAGHHGGGMRVVVGGLGAVHQSLGQARRQRGHGRLRRTDADPAQGTLLVSDRGGRALAVVL